VQDGRTGLSGTVGYRPGVPIAARTPEERELAHPKLKWLPYRPDARVDTGVKPAAAIESDKQEVSQAVVLEAADEPVGRPTRSSRAKLRDTILRVSTTEDDPFVDPFGEKTALAQQGRNASPSDELTEEPPPAESTERAEQELKETESADPEATSTTPMDESLTVPSMEEFESQEAPRRPTCEAEKEDCQKALQLLKDKRLSSIDLSIAVTGAEGLDFPCQCVLGRESFEPRCWQELIFTWKASALCHKPLYFEEVALERYGHSFNPLLLPFMSGAHFFATLPLLPYKMSLNPPDECVYALGYYRPGNCAPYLLPAFPLDVKAGLVEAGAIAGAILIFP